MILPRKNAPLLVLLAIQLTAGILFCQERPIPKGRDVTIQGQRLSGAYIEEITDTRITVRHARGTTFFHPKVVPKTLFEDHSDIQRQKAEYDDKLIVKAKLIQVLPQGAITQTSFVKWVTRERRVQVPGTLLDTKPRYKTENYESEELIPWEGWVFIYGIPPNYVDGEVWSGEVFPAGSYSYTTVTGASKTLRALATSAELAMKILANGSE